MHLKNSTVAERRFIGKVAAGCIPSSDLDPKPKIKHHRPLQVPEILTPEKSAYRNAIGEGARFTVYNQVQSQSHLTVEIPDSSSQSLTSTPHKRPVVVQSSHPFNFVTNVDDFRRGGRGSNRASLGSISSYCPSYLLSFLSSSLPSIPSATNQKLLGQVLRVRLICFHLRFLLLLSVPPLYIFFLLISFRIFLLFVFSIIAFSFILSISLKFALPHIPSIRLFIARLLSLKLSPTRSSSSSQESTKQVVWSIGSKPVTEKKTNSGSWVQKYSSGDVYEGEFHRGKCSGSGVYYYSMKGKYEGNWIDGKYDGYGVETWAKGSRYRGQYRQGMRHGTGIYRFYTGDVYAGEWSNGQSHGCGVYTSEDGSRFVGEFKWGVKHGLGHYHFRNGDTYAGEYFADRMRGFGVYHFGNGHLYEGAWHEGRRQGLGMYTFRNGDTHAGHWENGVLSCATEQTTRPGSSFSISHSKVLDTVQQARKAAEKAREVVKVEERVNRAVMVANRAANAARVAATKAVQTQTFYSSGGDDPLWLRGKMKRLLEFGRKVMFYVRVLSGYEERRIRNYRLQLEKRIQQAQQKKAEINRLPEKIVLSEVRRMVEQMQNLNKQIENTEAQIEDYFKPIDKQAGTIMEVQLESEKKTMGTMMAATQEETIRKIEEAERLARARGDANATVEVNTGEKIQHSESSANEKAQAK